MDLREALRSCESIKGGQSVADLGTSQHLNWVKTGLILPSPSNPKYGQYKNLLIFSYFRVEKLRLSASRGMDIFFRDTRSSSYTVSWLRYLPWNNLLVGDGCEGTLSSVYFIPGTYITNHPPEGTFWKRSTHPFQVIRVMHPFRSCTISKTCPQ